MVALARAWWSWRRDQERLAISVDHALELDGTSSPFRAVRVPRRDPARDDPGRCDADPRADDLWTIWASIGAAAPRAARLDGPRNALERARRRLLADAVALGRMSLPDAITPSSGSSYAVW